MENYKDYTPGPHKLLRHLDHLQKIIKGEVCGPLHISYFPNNHPCNLRCPYCCFQNQIRDNVELSLEDFKLSVDVLTKYGLKAAEISGGSDPLLWNQLVPAIDYAHSKGVKLSLVTNGLAIKNVTQSSLEKFAWIRFSIQSTNYARKVSFDYIPSSVKKSMSFIVHDDRSFKEIEKLYGFAKETNTIIRVAPVRPCSREWADKVEAETSKFGYPFLFFKKESGSPKGCYFAWVRAAIDWRGNFVVCPSPEQAYENYGELKEDFALCKISELDEWLQNNPPHDLGFRCSYCNCGKNSNDLIYNLLQPMENDEFV